MGICSYVVRWSSAGPRWGCDPSFPPLSNNECEFSKYTKCQYIYISPYSKWMNGNKSGKCTGCYKWRYNTLFVLYNSLSSSIFCLFLLFFLVFCLCNTEERKKLEYESSNYNLQIYYIFNMRNDIYLRKEGRRKKGRKGSKNEKVFEKTRNYNMKSMEKKQELEYKR